MRDHLGHTHEGILPRVQLVGGDGAGLDFGVFRRTLHDLELTLDREIVCSQFTLLEEESEDEPEKGKRCECAAEEVAEVAERHPRESGPTQ